MTIYAVIEKDTGRFAGSGIAQIETDTHTSITKVPFIPEGHEVSWDFDTEEWVERPVNVWVPNISYAVGHELRYERNTYKCLQPHTSQAGQPPPIIPALWESIGYEPPKTLPSRWSMGGGTGVSGSYVTNVLVTHDNPNEGGADWVYRSKLAANTTEPGRDGALNRWWEPVSSAADYTRWLNAGGTPVEPSEPPVDEWPEWVPWDGNNENLHQIGDKVTHQGNRYIANTGNNHWEPGVFGWDQQP